MRTVPDAAVVACLDRQPADSAWITGITLFEARFGLALLPLGRRRQTLEAAFAHLLKEDLENRVLDFHSAAATKLRPCRPRDERGGDRWICVTHKLRRRRLLLETFGTFWI
jgi:hypothetical protein